MNLSDFFQATSQFAYPIVVSGYLLLVIENKLDKVIKAMTDKDGVIAQIADLKEAVTRLTTAIDKLEGQMRRRR